MVAIIFILSQKKSKNSMMIELCGAVEQEAGDVLKGEDKCVTFIFTL